MGSLAVCTILLGILLLHRFDAMCVPEPKEINYTELSPGRREGQSSSAIVLDALPR